jgi:hypothetical protein
MERAVHISSDPSLIEASWPVELRQVLGDGLDETGKPIEELK